MNAPEVTREIACPDAGSLLLPELAPFSTGNTAP
jgi:hypothetical protein